MEKSSPPWASIDSTSYCQTLTSATAASTPPPSPNPFSSSLLFRLVPVPETVTVFRVEKGLDQNATELVHRWQFVADKIDNGLFMRLLILPISSRTQKGVKTIRATFISLFLGNSKQLMTVMNGDFPDGNELDSICALLGKFRPKPIPKRPARSNLCC
ncbi:hypothetical protein ACSBR2_014174 [Camellia fascicularis]